MTHAPRILIDEPAPARSPTPFVPVDPKGQTAARRAAEPTQDLEAEQALIAAALLDSEALKVLRSVPPTSFHDERHRLIAAAVARLDDRDVDLVTVRAALEDAGELVRVGGASYLSSLVDVLPDAAHATAYAERVLRLATEREALEALQIAAATWQPENLDRVEAAIRRVREMRTAPSVPSMRVVTWGELRSAELPAKPYLIEPWLRRRDQVLVFAKAGVGKSYWCKTLAVAIVHGIEVFGWKPRKGRVCYIDGEMDAAELRMRLLAIAAGMGVEIPDDGIMIVSRDYLALKQQRLPYMTDAATRDLFLRLIPEDADLVIYDNLSCLIGGEENDAAAMDNLIDFVLRLRGRGQAGIYVHHAGRSGEQRGSTRRVDILDTVVRLEALDEENDRFHVRWDKHRGFSHRDCPEFILELVLDKDPNSGHVIKAEWVQTGIEDERLTRLVAVYRTLQDADPKGKAPTVRDLGTELGMGKTTVAKWLDRARRRGLL